MSNFEYVKEFYQVPAELGRKVIVSGKSGIIAKDRGHYIGVNFDEDKPGVIMNCHPTSEVEYLGFGRIRKMTKSQARYQRYHEYGDMFNSFIDFCYWDGQKEHSWNNR